MHTWSELRTALPRPSIVVFSATWCANCPAIITDLAATARSLAPGSQLIIVVVDGAEQPALLKAPHYRKAHRLMVFDGEDAALRFSVSPGWRGVTPYVALLGRQDGAPVMISGRPRTEQLTEWAGR